MKKVKDEAQKQQVTVSALILKGIQQLLDSGGNRYANVWIAMTSDLRCLRGASQKLSLDSTTTIRRFSFSTNQGL